MRRLGMVGAVLATALGLGACAAARQDTAEALARPAGLTRETLPAGPFVLTAYSRFTDAAAPLVVYIEGDGFAWVTGTQVSPDPTPRDPVALRLAAVDGAPNVAYLARPCQYTPPGRDGRCAPRYWTSHRFAEDVVASADAAVTALARRAGGGVHLVGFSGGAAVAALVAARRGDVLSLRTVAGNLDPEAVNRHHKVSPLTGSLNPIDQAAALRTLPQRHYVGGRDTVVPAAVAASFAARVEPACVEVVRVPSATHGEGWDALWRAEAARRPVCR